MIEVIEKTPFVFEDGKIYYFSITARESSNTFHDLWVYEKKTIERKSIKSLRSFFWKKTVVETTDLVDEFVLINNKSELVRVDLNTVEIKREIADIYYLYMNSKSEKLVRSSEIAGELVSSDITKKEFKEFLNNTSLYKHLITMSNFSYDKMKSDLYKDIPLIKKRLSQSDIEIPTSDDEIVELILELTYENIVGNAIGKLHGMMTINPFKQLLNLISKEEEDYFNNYIKKSKFNNKEDYFLYCQKMINFESNKVLKKISKLYDMCKDTNVNKLHSKISSKSIVNPKLHDKFVATDKSIKKYESFKKLD